MPTQDHTPYLSKKLFTLTLCILINLNGCSSLLGGYGTNGLSKDDFSHYVEDVFRLQNRMTSEIMALSDIEDATRHNPALAQAEQHMQKMCSDLNEYVSRDLDGLQTGLLLRRRVEKSAQHCERAAQAIGALLKLPNSQSH